MKRVLCVFLLLALGISLCACGAKEEQQTSVQSLVPVDLSTGAWLGQGGCYRMEPLDLPGDIQFCREGQIYSMDYPSVGKTMVYRDGEELFSCEGMAYCLSKGEEGIWLQEDERDGDTWFFNMKLYSYDGEPQKQFRRS